MHHKTELPPTSWSQTFVDARTEQGLDIGTLSRELMLSLAQLRGLESGKMTAFHGTHYYLRAAEKYAVRLGVELVPSVQEVLDSEAAPTDKHPGAQQVRAMTGSKPYPVGMEMSRRQQKRSGVGLWITVILVALLGTGLYMAVDEGWPSSTDAPDLAQTDDSQTAELVTLVPRSQQEAPSPLQGYTPAAQADRNVSSLRTPTTDAKTIGIPGDPQKTQGSDPSGQTQVNTTSDSTLQAETDLRKVQSDERLTQRNVQPDKIVLTFSGDCWVEIRQKDGQTLQKVFKSGETTSIAVDEIERLVLGNISTVQAQRAGETLDLATFTRGTGTVARIDGQALSKTAL